MLKSPDAFRTISEVAEDLDLPQHVLRFWETRFPQIRPLKRAGGRRYYRPADVSLLRSIRQLLYDDGYTIKGVQRLLKEQGSKSVRAGETTPPEAGIVTGDADKDTAADKDMDKDAVAGNDLDGRDETASGALEVIMAVDGFSIAADIPAAGSCVGQGSAPGAARLVESGVIPPLAEEPSLLATLSAPRFEDADAIREALEVIEDCVRILRAARSEGS